MNLTDEEIRHLLSYARGKFETERYPFAPALLKQVLENQALISRTATGSDRN